MAILKVLVKDKSSSKLVRFEMDSQSHTYQNLQIEDDAEKNQLIKDIHFADATISIVANDNANQSDVITQFKFNKKQKSISYMQNGTPVNLGLNESPLTIESSSTALDELDKMLGNIENEQPISNTDVDNFLKENKSKLKPTTDHPLQGSEELLSNSRPTIKKQEPEKTYMTLEEIQAAQTNVPEVAPDIPEAAEESTESFAKRIYAIRLPIDKKITIGGKNYDTIRLITTKINDYWVTQEIWAGNSVATNPDSLSDRTLLNDRVLPLQDAMQSIVSTHSWTVKIHEAETKPRTIHLNSKPSFETLASDPEFSTLTLGTDAIVVPHELSSITVQPQLDVSETYVLKPPKKNILEIIRDFLFRKKDSEFPYQEIILTARSYTGIDQPLAIQLYGLPKDSGANAGYKTEYKVGYKNISEFEDNLSFQCVYKNKKHQLNYDKEQNKLELINLEDKEAIPLTFALDESLKKPKYYIKPIEIPEVASEKMAKNPMGTVHGVMPRSKLPIMTTAEEETAAGKKFRTRTESGIFVPMPSRKSRKETAKKDTTIAQEIDTITKRLTAEIDAPAASIPAPIVEQPARAKGPIYIITPASADKTLAEFKEIQLILNPDFTFASAAGIYKDKSTPNKNFTTNEFDMLLNSQLWEHSRIAQQLSSGQTNTYENCSLVKDKNTFKVRYNLIDPLKRNPRGTLDSPLPASFITNANNTNTENSAEPVKNTKALERETDHPFPIFMEDGTVKTNADIRKEKEAAEKEQETAKAPTAISPAPEPLAEMVEIENAGEVQPLLAAEPKAELPLKDGLMAKIARHFREKIPTFESKHKTKLNMGELLHEHLNEEQRKLYRKNSNVESRREALLAADAIYQSISRLEKVYRNNDSAIVTRRLEVMDMDSAPHILERAKQNEKDITEQLQEARDDLLSELEVNARKKNFKLNALNEEIEDLMWLSEKRQEKIETAQQALTNASALPAATVYGAVNPNNDLQNVTLKAGSYILTREEYNNSREQLQKYKLADNPIETIMVDNSKANVLSDNPFIAYRETIANEAANEDQVIFSVLTDKNIKTQEGNKVYHGGAISRSASSVVLEKAADIINVKNKPAKDIFLRYEMMILQAVAAVNEFKRSDIQSPVLISSNAEEAEIWYKVFSAYKIEFENRSAFKCPEKMRVAAWMDQVVGNEKKPNMETLTVSSMRQWLNQHNLMDEKMLSEQLETYYQNRPAQGH